LGKLNERYTDIVCYFYNFHINLKLFQNDKDSKEKYIDKFNNKNSMGRFSENHT
jgi:hypothetical protein